MWASTVRARALLGFSVACHALVVASLAYTLPALWHAVETRGRADCDLAHVTVAQAIGGTVCGQRMFDIRERNVAHGGARSGAR